MSSPAAKLERAAQSVLVSGERIVAGGPCWAVQPRPGVPLFLMARRQFGLVLTDRRVLVFRRRRRGPRTSDLVIGKRFESFHLARDHTRALLRQVVVQVTNGGKLVFEFRRGQRPLGDALVARLGSPTEVPVQDSAS